jgi:Protein of unknown function (DUF3108)
MMNSPVPANNRRISLSFFHSASIMPFIFAALFLLTVFSEPAAAERLVYDLSWTGITAGTATQELIQEKDDMRIISIARSADWRSVIFPVEDRVVSILSLGTATHLGLPKNFRMTISEGHHRRDREIIFDHARKKALYIDHRSSERTEVPIGANTYDAYSSFYYLRNLDLETGKSVFVSILDNKDLYDVEVQVLRKERLKTILGDVNTILIKPIMKTEGIFNRKGAIYIWLTDDARRIPVLMKTKVAIGSITATLVEMTN